MTEDKWKTAITEIKRGEIRVRGYDIREMMEKLSFSDAVFLILKGELPTKEESEMMRAILVSSVDHGVTPPSVLSARSVLSGGNPLNSAVAGGILTIGDVHGGAIERCARILQDWARRTEDRRDLICCQRTGLRLHLQKKKDSWIWSPLARNRPQNGEAFPDCQGFEFFWKAYGISSGDRSGIRKLVGEKTTH